MVNPSKKNKENVDKKVEVEAEDIKEEEKEEIKEEPKKMTGNKRSRAAKLEKDVEKLGQEELTTGVIYIGHLPWGFEDKGIKKYFEQFGKINRILVPKSKKVIKYSLIYKLDRKNKGIRIR
jgi:nucleolar protein 15